MTFRRPLPSATTATRTAVFVHGAGGGGWEWGIWLRVFAAAGFEVMAPDLEAASKGLAATSMADYSRQVAAWLETARGSRVLVGASLGGRLAQMQATQADALVLVNPVPLSGVLRAAPRPGIVPWGRKASLEGTLRALPDADALTALWAFRRWRDESGLALDQAQASLGMSAPHCPVLVFASEQDEDVPLQHSLQLAEEWKTSLRRWPGSHVGPLLGRQAALAAGQAVDWLNDLPPAR